MSASIVHPNGDPVICRHCDEADAAEYFDDRGELAERYAYRMWITRVAGQEVPTRWVTDLEWLRRVARREGWTVAREQRIEHDALCESCGAKRREDAAELFADARRGL